MIIQIVNPFDASQQYNPLLTINTRSKGVTKLTLKYAINQPNEVQAVFNANLPKFAYEAIKDGDYGLRIKKDGHDILMVQDPASKNIDSQGQISLKFFSSIYKMIYSQARIANTQYVRRSAIEIANLIDGYEFILISPDRQVNLTNGDTDNLTIFNNLRKATGGWSYFDSGLYPRGDGTYSNRILLGEYDNIENYANIDSRFATETLEAQNVRNIFRSNPILLDVTSYNNGRTIKFLKAVLDTGQGAGATNSSQTFRRTDYDFVDPLFPLVNINGIIFIQDTSYSGLEERFVTYPVTLTASSDNGAGSQVYDIDDAFEYLYRKAVYYMRTQKTSTRIDCEIAFRRLTFPKYLNVNFQKSITNRRGEKIQVQNINEKILYKELEFDLTNL